MAPATARRKLVQHGPSSLIVSLPARWIRLNNLQKGDEILIEERAHTLTLSTNNVTNVLSIVQDVSHIPPFLVTRFLARSYQKGYDEIRLTYSEPELLKTIQEKLHELIGYEITDQDERGCTIKCITAQIELNFDASLRRAFLITRDMLDVMQKAYAQGDKKSLANLYIRDFEVNKLCYFCLRYMNKNGSDDPAQAHQSHVLYYLIEILEDLGDALKALATKLSANGKPHKNITELIALMRKQWDISYEYFYKPTLSRAIEAYHLYKEVEGKIDELAGDKLKGDELIALMFIRDSSSIIYHFTTMRLDFLAED